MQSEKLIIRHLVKICAQKGVNKVVLSPGSRNAPLTISFDEFEGIECYSVPDERSAAFFALGMAIGQSAPVAICCTSGSASLNYAPAIAEAYYQKVPLLVLTADRPVEWVDQGDGQTIRQNNLYANYIRGFWQLPQETVHPDEIWSAGRMINQAIDQTIYPVPGPVHINIPLRENLYNLTEEDVSTKIIQQLRPEPYLSTDQLDELLEEWNQYDRKLVLCGQMLPNEGLQKALEILSDDSSVTVLTETTANLHHHNFNACIDRLISGFNEEDNEEFRPQLLITIGDAIVSKKIKAYLRNHQPSAHWHISPYDTHLDTFQSLTRSVLSKPETVLHFIKNKIESNQSGYRTKWKGRDLLTQSKHDDFLQGAEFSDLKAYQTVLDFVPDNVSLHMANSTAVRYVQLFSQIRGIEYYANRGTSGIDGSTSTAAGVACNSDKLNVLVTGDMSFLYDSNALWNNHLTENLRVIIFNNSGGGIFRIIPGPDSTKQLDKFFDTDQKANARYICQQFDVNYQSATTLKELEKALTNYFQPTNNKRPAVLEIFTPKLKNDQVLKDYFKHLRI